MAKRRVKKRTHPIPTASTTNNASRTPKSMVIRIGASDVGPSISQLVRDVRSTLEPLTAARLKERRSNKLRDYTTMAGPLGVSHLLLFSRSQTSGNVNLRVCVSPRGPTLHFRVERYSLCKDVQKSMRRPKAGVKEGFLAPPLLVMNNFTSKDEGGKEGGEEKKERIPKHLETLTTSIFQSLFPPINPTTTPLKSIKRILLLDRVPQTTSHPTSTTDDLDDKASYILNLRHYAIETRTPKSVPKALRRLDAAEKLTHASQTTSASGPGKRKRSALPNLGKLNDVADYLLDPTAADGFTSASESEPDTDAEVEVLAPSTQKIAGRHAKKEKDGERRDRRAGPNVEKKGIKLHELGPRLRLRLTKVEEGVCGGRVMWHEYIHKTKEEMKEMERVHEVRRQEKERRKAEQKANLERKRRDRKARGEEVVQEGDEDEDGEGWSDDEWDDEGMGDGDGEEEAEEGKEDEEMG